MARHNGTATLLGAALRWAAWGMPVFPLLPNKRPLKVKDPATGRYPPHGKGGFHLATTDPDVIHKWWTAHPTALIGGRMGKESGVVAVDVDKGAQLNGLVLPRAARVHRTPNKGRHLLYTHPGMHVPRDNTGKLAPGVDWMGDGSYIVLPPSRANGGAYRAVRKGSKAALTDPAHLTELVRAGTPPGRAAEVAGDQQKSKHKTITDVAWQLACTFAGLPREVALAHLLALDAQHEDPIQFQRGRGTKEVEAAWDSAVAKLRADPLAPRVREAVEQLEVRERARREYAAQQAGPGFTFPAAGLTLADFLAEPRSKAKYTIEQLHTAGGNTLLVAQYKTGKTTLLANLLLALLEGVDFLGKFPVAPVGRVAFWNYELDEDLFRDWLSDIGVKHPERAPYPLNLRAKGLQLWDQAVREEAVAWLRREEVGFLLVDPAARAMRGLVDNENDNSQVAAFTDALDELKEQAGVQDLVISTHMGRAFVGTDEERSRGATRLEDWMDHGWYMTKDGKAVDAPRDLRAIGRDVALEALHLEYDGVDRRLVCSGRTREERRAGEGVKYVVAALAGLGGESRTTGELTAVMKGDTNKHNTWVQAASDGGYIERPERGAQALGAVLTEEGWALAGVVAR